MRILKRFFLELCKIGPLLALILASAFFFGDASQLKLAAYYLAAIALSALIWHIARKCLYPTFSLERHCQMALDGNIAAALVVCAMLAWQAAMSWLLVLCLVAMVAK